MPTPELYAEQMKLYRQYAMQEYHRPERCPYFAGLSSRRGSFAGSSNEAQKCGFATEARREFNQRKIQSRIFATDENRWTQINTKRAVLNSSVSICAHLAILFWFSLYSGYSLPRKLAQKLDGAYTLAMPSPQDSPTEIAPPLKRGDRPATEIRLVAVDLDGTLLDAHKQVSPPTVEAIHAVCHNNVKVVIASARPPRSVRHIYKLLELDTWQINYNGASSFWDDARGRVLFHRPLSAPAHPADHGRRPRPMFDEVQVSVEILDKWYHRPPRIRLHHRDRPDSSPVSTRSPRSTNVLQSAGDQADVPRRAENHLRTRGVAAVRDFPEASILRADPELIQVMHPDASKAAALSPRRPALRRTTGFQVHGHRRRGERHPHAPNRRRPRGHGKRPRAGEAGSGLVVA